MIQTSTFTMNFPHPNLNIRPLELTLSRKIQLKLMMKD
jgi:hypothetical protein